jgi:hypothetical protein
MKTQVRGLLVIFLSAISLISIAQVGNIVVFAPKGDKFTLFIGSTSQNSEPSARVEADNPGGPSFKIKVVFPDPSVKEISKLVFNKPSSTMFYKVEKSPKGTYTLESTSSEWMDDAVSGEKANPPQPSQEAPSPAKDESKSGDTKKNESASTAKTKGCDNPMPEPDFNGQLISISAQPFEPMELSAAKKMAETACLTVSQVIRVIYIFDSESSRLSFAKYAYDHTYDRDNYAEVKEALHSEKSRVDLDKYVAGKTK